MQKLTKSYIFNQIESPMASLARSLAGNACSGEINSFRNDKVLMSNFQNITDIIRTDVDGNINEYCKARLGDNVKFVDCLVDFEEFSSDFLSHCDESGGIVYPVSLLLRCSKSGDSQDIELEMELMNVPSCFGQSCTREESYRALVGILDASEQPISGISSSYHCQFYHDYDYLSNPPKVLKSEVSFEEDFDTSISSGTFRSGFPGVVVLSIIASLGLESFWN
mmetsp:Transcript_11724/g.21926  ORF Transcript_11724/g.21926 Transcript_11724/m.21926 type:complete len:223 (+) Transcript_11724:98-766(+)